MQRNFTFRETSFFFRETYCTSSDCCMVMTPESLSKIQGLCVQKNLPLHDSFGEEQGGILVPHVQEFITEQNTATGDAVLEGFRKEPRRIPDNPRVISNSPRVISITPKVTTVLTLN